MRKREANTHQKQEEEILWDFVVSYQKILSSERNNLLWKLIKRLVDDRIN